MGSNGDAVITPAPLSTGSFGVAVAAARLRRARGGAGRVLDVRRRKVQVRAKSFC